jgi:hypothetical protein
MCSPDLLVGGIPLFPKTILGVVPHIGPGNLVPSPGPESAGGNESWGVAVKDVGHGGGEEYG